MLLEHSFWVSFIKKKASLRAVRLHRNVGQGMVRGDDWEICVRSALVISSKY